MVFSPLNGQHENMTTPIQEFTSHELIQELRSRSDSFAIAFSANSGNNEQEMCITFGSDHVSSVGLAHIMMQDMDEFYKTARVEEDMQ
jgi:hypothetical protein